MRNLKFVTLLLIIVMGLTACNRTTEPEGPAVIETETEVVEVIGEIEIVEETNDRSYLTGEYVGETARNRRPFAIMLNNIINACPQAGIEKASIVYEAPVEGSMTRLMGIFDDISGMEKIGSVRSCRDYFPMMAIEYDAFYVHFGQAVYAFDLLNSELVDNISGLSYQPQAGDIYGYAGEEVFYRTSDRVAPHNCYTNEEGLEKAIKTLSYRREHEDDFKSKFQFAGDEETIELEGGSATKITPGYIVNEPWFEYRDGKYARFQYEEPQIDELTEEQLLYTNIIFQVAESEFYDENGYLDIDTMSGGEAYYFTNGTYEKCTWKRTSETSPARYYGADGQEIVLNQGKTWVCIILANSVENIVIE